MKLTNNLYFYPEQGMLDSNTYVINGGPGIIIDPGNPAFLPTLVNRLHKDGIEPGDIGIIANTHLHADHCSANEEFKKLSGARIAVHPVQKEHYRQVVFDVAGVFGMPPVEFREDYILDDSRLSAGGIELEMIVAPGHSPDCVCFYDRKEKALICGDVLFEQNTGRVDLPGGSAAELRASIERLSFLDVEYLLPGHMDIVTGRDRVRDNFSFIKENILKWL